MSPSKLFSPRAQPPSRVSMFKPPILLGQSATPFLRQTLSSIGNTISASKGQVPIQDLATAPPESYHHFLSVRPHTITSRSGWMFTFLLVRNRVFTRRAYAYSAIRARPVYL